MQKILRIEKQLAKELNELNFPKPVSHVYNPIDYAWDSFRQFTETYGSNPKKILFLGMNPGPYGMAQTGVPFGEVNMVKDWLKIQGKIKKPKNEHPKRSIMGFDCHRNEISGQRLWGYLKEQYRTPKRFFKDHYIINYCNLIFLEESGRNLTPDKLPLKSRNKLYETCDAYLEKKVAYYQPEIFIGIGAFAKTRIQKVFGKNPDFRTETILHPSPASPAANKGWSEKVHQQLTAIYSQAR